MGDDYNQIGFTYQDILATAPESFWLFGYGEEEPALNRRWMHPIGRREQVKVTVRKASWRDRLEKT